MHVLFNLNLMLLIFLGCMFYALRCYYLSAKNKRFIAWHMVSLTSLVIYALLHLLLDKELFSPAMLEALDYWVTHIFVIVPALISAYLVKEHYERK